MDPAYPTPEHGAAARAITNYFIGFPQVEAILLTNSCARGKASRDSCLDMVIFLHPKKFAESHQEIEAGWNRFLESNQVFQQLTAAGRFSEVHLDLIGYEFQPGQRGWMSGPDEFELAIGNFLVYSRPLWQRGSAWEQFCSRWLPYYGEDLRKMRLAEAQNFCRNNLEHIYLYAPRGLLFGCLHRLYMAHKELLQAVFIKRRIYPLAYDKWIHEQVVEILGEPALYEGLVDIFNLSPFSAETLLEKARLVEELLEQYAA